MATTFLSEACRAPIDLTQLVPSEFPVFANRQAVQEKLDEEWHGDSSKVPAYLRTDQPVTISFNRPMVDLHLAS